MLHAADDDELCVRVLAASDVSDSAISHALSKLTDAGPSRAGKKVNGECIAPHLGQTPSSLRLTARGRCEERDAPVQSGPAKAVLNSTPTVLQIVTTIVA